MRRAAVIVATSFVLAGLAVANAVAGDYVVAQCHTANVASEASPEGADRGDYGMRNECSASPDHALKVVSTSGASSGHRGYWFWQAPAGTRIVSVKIEAKLRRDGGHKARVYVADDAGQQIALVASGADGATEFSAEHWSGPPESNGASRLYAALVCDNNGASCPVSSAAKTFVRNVEITLRDVVPPSAVLGDGLSDGWKRGSFPMQPVLSDSGGGISVWFVSVNGAAISITDLACNPPVANGNVPTMTPCPIGISSNPISLQSGVEPFHDGSNQLKLCAYDFASGGSPNTTCSPATTVLVDNTAPTLSFSNQQLASDPELIEVPASDATSGLLPDSGQIEFRRVGSETWDPLTTTFADGAFTTRVDSSAYPAGTYEFRASASDGAGNATSTVLRGDRSTMALQFPLKDPVELDAFFPGGQTKRLATYRQPGRVRGFLLNPDGSPVVDQRVVIREEFDDGSLVQRRTDRARTAADGSFHAKLPGGPSRSVTVHYPGSSQYQSDRAPELDYNVRSRVALIAQSRVRAGESARFRGKIGRYFARLPAGGKLVELQYKKRARTWNTAKEAVGTNRKGAISLGYRFRRYYAEPVTFIFRLKVTRESRWPYRLPATSKSVAVTVIPRHR